MTNPKRCAPLPPERRNPPRWLAALLLAGAAAAATAQAPAAPASVAPASASAALTAAQAQLARLQALRAQRPGDGMLVYFEALLRVRAGETEAALAALRSLVGRGLGIVPAPGIGFEPVWDDPAFLAVRRQLADGESRTASAPESFRLADPKLIPEGIAFDPAHGRFYVGSIAQRKIVGVDRDGKALAELSRPGDGLDGVLGLAVDPRTRSLYAVSTNVFDEPPEAERRNVVFRYDLATGALVERLPVPSARQLNDVAVGPDGALYATDSAAGALFRRRPGEAGFSAWLAAGGLPGANGVAVGLDGTVYVALSTGIARIDRDSAAVERMAQPDSAVTGGIDGLYWHEGDLIGVQNVSNPGRVIRVRLADGGRRIAGVAVLQSHHHPAFAEPTTGAIAGSALHVIANSHVGRLQPGGELKDAATLRPTVVLAVPLAVPAS